MLSYILVIVLSLSLFVFIMYHILKHKKLDKNVDLRENMVNYWKGQLK